MYFNPAEGEHKENILLRFNSLPPVGLECRAFPPDDQEPLACAPRYNLTIAFEREEQKPFYHSVGTAFHNPPNGKYSENFNILLDSYPLSRDVRGYAAQLASSSPDATDTPF
jgi:hypothetical protein